MQIKNLTKVYISKSEEVKDHGEPTKQWTYISYAFLNLQQDVNELDVKSTGEVNYDIYKARTDREYNIKNGYGISLTDISKSNNFIPEYRVLDQNKIGNTVLYRLEKYYGD
jgi:hypothetical protein